MFHCQLLNKVSKSGESPIKLTIQSRVKVYKHWDNEQEEYWDSFGSEIVKEISVSSEGLDLWNSMGDDERERLLRHLKLVKS